ncbi:hypothetical protein HBH74_088390 [Parastagonospora nodorum]|nr:hypothetical protein HBH47_022690 [Parastagonospora nodorum]KAH4934184.1 hypothetical protein HBH74_088390 [Parastagonospora nodorum]KAH4970685.1 hypothetical protein HBH73_054610 [Parastagonospora nodorum]KAH5121209.1 hypothetical protein HBH71_054230 [Parastagonospora nodorum]
MVIQTVGIVGTGVIGASWTGLFLAHGLRVLVADPAPGAKEKLEKHLKAIWPTLQSIGTKKSASLANYTFVGASLGQHYKKVDFVQENAPERQNLKQSLLAEIDSSVRSDVVIASSSSGIPSSRFISKCKTPERVLIGHPFNPPHLMPLVEVVPHPGTSSIALETAMAFYKSIGHRPIHVKKEVPGFVANRLQAALCSEAYGLVSRGVVGAEDLDACVTNSLGPRWAMVGPLMANAMGGGGGAEGFKHLLEHLGPASRGWVEDMREHEFDWSEESVGKLSESVGEELDGRDVDALEKRRDEGLVRLFKENKH